MSIVAETYNLTKSFPTGERFGWTNQVTRAAVSIPSNIAEGSSRDSDKQYKQYPEIALGSAFELETQLIIAGQIGYVKEEKLRKILDEITEEQRMLQGFIKQLKN